VVLWAALLATTAHAGAMEKAARWAKRHERVADLGRTTSDGFYWRYRNRRDKTIYFTDPSGRRPVTTATDYVDVERIPDGMWTLGAWGHRSEDPRCRARSGGLIRGARSQHIEGLDCSFDWIAPDGTVVERFDNVAGIWLDYVGVRTINGNDSKFPDVAAIVQRDPAGGFWFRFINFKDELATTPWMPELLFVGNNNWQIAAIPLPTGEMWPIGKDGNRVGKRRSIAGYTPIFEPGSEALWGWLVRHEVGDENPLYGIADKWGDEVVPPTYASFDLKDNGWCEIRDPSGRVRTHPLALVRDATLWADSLAEATEVAHSAMAHREAMEAARERAMAAEEARLARLAAESAAREEAFRREMALAHQRWEEAEREQRAWCDAVVTDIESENPPPVADLDDAVRVCEEHVDADALAVLQRGRWDAYADTRSKPNRMSWAEALVSAGVNGGGVRSGSGVYSGSSAGGASVDLSAIQDRAAAARADARFDQFMNYISGSSTYDPSPVYRYTR